MSECKNHIDIVSTMEYHKKKEGITLGVDTSVLDIDSSTLGWIEKAALAVIKLFGSRKTPVNSKRIRAQIQKMYGTLDERKTIAFEIQTLLNKHPGIVKMFEYDLMKKVTKMEDKELVKVTQSPEGFGTVDLKTVPVPVLKSVFHYLNDIISHGFGEKMGQGLVGKAEVQYGTPRKQANKEVTGALFDMRQDTRDFPMEQANQLARFLGPDFLNEHKVTDPDNPNGPKILRDYGMNDIMDEINAIATDPSLSDKGIDNPRTIMVDMFIRYLTRDDTGQRRLKFDDAGNIIVATTYTPTDELWKGSDTDYKHQYGGYVPYEDIYGTQTIPLTPEMLQKFTRQAFKYDELHKNLWDTLKHEFGIAQEDLYNELKSLFKSDGVVWEDSEIEALFFKEDPADYSKFKGLNKEQQNLVRSIHKHATRYNILKPFVFNARDGEDGEGNGRLSFPIVYEPFRFSTMWDDMIYKYEGLLGEVEDQLTIKDMDLLTKHRLTMAKGRYESILKRAYWIRDRKDDYPVDMGTGTALSLGVDSKHMDHISNAFNILEQRTDEGAYHTYLQHSFAMLQRNKLSTTLIRSLKKAGSEPVRDYLWSMYKVATYQPDAPSGLLWLKYDSESISRYFGNVGINISAATIDRKMRQVLSYTGGNLLRGHTTAVQNMTAIIQKTIDMGPQRVIEAYKILGDGGKEINRVIGLSGVVDFREFFSRQLTNDARNLGGSRKLVMEMTVGMINFWKKADKIPKNAKNRGERIEKLRQELQDELGFAINSIPSRQRLEKRQKIQRDEMRTAVLRKWVDFAINKEYEANPYVTNNTLLGKLYRAGAPIVEMYAAFNQEHMPTMGKTESTLRALSFIIGVRAAMDVGYIRKGDITKLDPVSLRQAIAIGREYVEMLDFGMSRQDLGQAGHSNVGAFFTQFKVWSFQKMAKDLETVENAYRELADIDTEWFDFKAGLKMFAALKPFNKKHATRAMSPGVAAFRSWIWTQGLWTAIWDFFIMGPLLVIPGVRKVSRFVPGMRAIGGSTSDLVSLILMIPSLGYALANGEGDDQWDKIFDYYSRKTFFGFGASWTIDHLMTMIAFMSNADEEEKARRILRSIQPLLPPPLKEVSGAAKGMLEEVVK